MKALAAVLFFVELTLATAVPRLNRRVAYDGFKAFRIETDDTAAVEEQLSRLSVVHYNLNAAHIDVAVAPQDVPAFEALELKTEVIHEDLGADIAGEGVFGSYEGSSSSPFRIGISRR